MNFPHSIPPFSEIDLADLSARGIAPEAAAAQLRLYADPPPPARLVRPCSPGDGIVRLTPEQAGGYASRYDEQARSMQVAKLVPASGAASRMFRSLLAALANPSLRTHADFEARAAAGDTDAGAVLEMVARLRDFAFFDLLAAELGRKGLDVDAAAVSDVRAILHALLDDRALGYASLPKGLLAFHREAGQVRTAFEEHLIEAAEYARGAGNVSRLHFTVSPEHDGRFRELLERVRPGYEARFDVRYEVGFSEQKPSTDTIAVDPEGRPFRTKNGRLLFRPAGHGALIENLAEVHCDLLFVKNIDNVAVEELWPVTSLWKRALAGLLLELRDEMFAHRRAVESGSSAAIGAAAAFLKNAFGTVCSHMDEAEVAGELERPLRACGMVSSDTNPGGGPFWVTGRAGNVIKQVVENSQVDLADPQQKAILESARHFNPVDLVCITRDWKGRAIDLSRFIDHDAVFIAEKSQDGRPLRSLERPGLWNGAMAGWNTVFVEVPLETFNPVKTVNDLLGRAHQGRRS